jgi:hypothetical protein
MKGLAMEAFGMFYSHLVSFTPIGMFCDHLVYFMVIWYIFQFWLCCTKKNLATLYGLNIMLKKISFFIVKPLRFLRMRRRRNKKTCLVQIRLM